jgi:hypothetical protein
MLAALLLALPAGAAATAGGQVQSLAAQQCSQQRSDIGRRAFHKRYGAKHAMRTCIKRTRPQVASVVDPAVQSCEQELAQYGSAEFMDEYLDETGTVDDAMTECIAETVDELLNPDDYVDDGTDDE